jgi:O-methyltransferase
MTLTSFLGRFASLGAKRHYHRLRHIVTGKKEYWHWPNEEKDAFFRRALVCLHFNEISGDYAEFGVHSAVTFGMAHSYIRDLGSKRRMWAFDSFEGLPVSETEEHPHWQPGILSTSQSDFEHLCRQHGIKPAELSCVRGVYSDTIGPNGSYTGRLPTDLALVYIDCDMLSSTRDVLHFLRPRLKHGMIIAFDDYFVFDAKNLSGNRQAFLELIYNDLDFNFLPYLTFSWNGMSFIVEQRSLLPNFQPDPDMN